HRSGQPVRLAQLPHPTRLNAGHCGPIYSPNHVLGFPSYRGDIAKEVGAMADSRRKFDEDFKQGAVRLVHETGKPIAQVAGELGINEGTLGNWCAQDHRRRGQGALSESEREELRRLRKENAELRMRCDVLKRSAALR